MAKVWGHPWNFHGIEAKKSHSTVQSVYNTQIKTSPTDLWRLATMITYVLSCPQYLACWSILQLNIIQPKYKTHIFCVPHKYIQLQVHLSNYICIWNASCAYQCLKSDVNLFFSGFEIGWHVWIFWCISVCDVFVNIIRLVHLNTEATTATP